MGWKGLHRSLIRSKSVTGSSDARDIPQQFCYSAAAGGVDMEEKRGLKGCEGFGWQVVCLRM